MRIIGAIFALLFIALAAPAAAVPTRIALVMGLGD